MSSNEGRQGHENEGRVIHLVIDGIQTYASVNNVFNSDNEGIYLTDDYFVYLLHPKHGSCFFTIVMDENGLLKGVDGPEWIDEELLHRIIESLNQPG